MVDLTKLNRKTVRYFCFRFSTEANGGAKSEGAPDGLREHFEKLAWFQGWKNFGSTWDVVHSSPLEIVPLTNSLVSSWDNDATSNAKEFPSG